LQCDFYVARLRAISVEGREEIRWNLRIEHTDTETKLDVQDLAGIAVSARETGSGNPRIRKGA
jgi:hypothetical protein